MAIAQPNDSIGNLLDRWSLAQLDDNSLIQMLGREVEQLRPHHTPLLQKISNTYLSIHEKELEYSTQDHFLDSIQFYIAVCEGKIEETPSEARLEENTLNEELDALHTTMTTPPTDINETWFYWVKHFYLTEKLAIRHIIQKLDEMYPWYRTRTPRSKNYQLTKLIAGMDHGANSHKVIRHSDEDIISGLKKCYEYQKKHPKYKLRAVEFKKISSIDDRKLKRKTGRIIENKFKQRKVAELKDLLKMIKALDGPWKMPEWDWYFLSKIEVNLLIKGI